MNDPWKAPEFESHEKENEAKIAKIELIVQQHTANIHNKKAAVQRDAVASIRQRADNQRTLREEIVKFENYIQEHQQKIPEAHEQAKLLAEQLEVFRTQHQARLTKLKNMKQTRDRLKASIERRKADKEVQTSKARKQLEKAELIEVRESLQLTITGLGDFKNKFEFKCINDKFPEQVYSFVLRLPEDGIYSVTECDPSISNLDELVDKLQQENDPYPFIKRMRKAFCEYAANCNSNNSSSSSSSNSNNNNGDNNGGGTSSGNNGNTVEIDEI